MSLSYTKHSITTFTLLLPYVNDKLILEVDKGVNGSNHTDLIHSYHVYYKSHQVKYMQKDYFHVTVVQTEVGYKVKPSPNLHNGYTITQWKKESRRLAHAPVMGVFS